VPPIAIPEVDSAEGANLPQTTQPQGPVVPVVPIP